MTSDTNLPPWLRQLYHYDSHFVRLGRWNCHYLDEGQGDPVVMLHGNPTWSFMYRHLVDGLRDRFRVVVPDHIGCGLSDHPGREGYTYTLEQRARDLEGLLEALQLDRPASLVLHDWGGLIGCAYATRYPARISRMVVLNTAAFHVPPEKDFNQILQWCRTSRLAAFMILRLNLFSRAATNWGSRMRRMPRLVRRAYRYPYRSARDRQAVLSFIQDIPLSREDPSYEAVSRIQAGLSRLRDKPMLLCWGELDPVFDRDFLLEWQRRFPDAFVQKFTRAGHYILEDAHETIVPLVREFLEAPLKQNDAP